MAAVSTPAPILAPFMIHELFPSLTETASGSHPCCVVSVTYDRTSYFHGGNTGSNPVGDANSFQELKRAQAVFRRHKKEAELLRYFASRMSIHRWRLFLTRRSYISKLSLWKCTSNPRRNPA
jgi:hypothetical protein